MKTVSFQSVFEQALRLAGHDPEESGMESAALDRTAVLISSALRKGWDAAWWKESMAAEQRDWVATPSEDGRKEIDMAAQEGEDGVREIYRVEELACLYTKDPLTYPRAPAHPALVCGDRIIARQRTGSALPSKPWVKFQIAPPTYEDAGEETLAREDFPAFLKDYVALYVSSQLMQEDEGRYRTEAQANAILDDLVERKFHDTDELTAEFSA